MWVEGRGHSSNLVRISDGPRGSGANLWLTFAKERGPSPPGGLFDAMITPRAGWSLRLVKFHKKEKKKIRDQVKQRLHSARFGFTNVKKVETCLVGSNVAA